MIESILKAANVFRHATGDDVETLARMHDAGLIPKFIMYGMTCANVFVDPRPILEATDVLHDLGFHPMIGPGGGWSMSVQTQNEVMRIVAINNDAQQWLEGSGEVWIDGAPMNPQPRSIGGLIFRLFELADDVADR